MWLWLWINKMGSLGSFFFIPAVRGTLLKSVFKISLCIGNKVNLSYVSSIKTYPCDTQPYHFHWHFGILISSQEDQTCLPAPYLHRARGPHRPPVILCVWCKCICVKSIPRCEQPMGLALLPRRVTYFQTRAEGGFLMLTCWSSSTDR